MDEKLIVALANARRKADQAKKEFDLWKQQVANQPDWIQLQEDYELAKQDLENADVAFRAAAISEYIQTKEKHSDSHDVEDKTIFTIPDPEAAKVWCLSNFTPALSVDEKAFLAAAKNKAIPKHLFKTAPSYGVKIKSDLSSWLEDLFPLD